jgi:hypothetical protein
MPVFDRRLERPWWNVKVEMSDLEQIGRLMRCYITPLVVQDEATMCEPFNYTMKYKSPRA